MKLKAGEWDVLEDRRPLVSDRRPEFRMLTVSRQGFAKFGASGELVMTFYNDRLMTTLFYPTDLDALRSGLAREAGISFSSQGDVESNRRPGSGSAKPPTAAPISAGSISNSNAGKMNGSTSTIADGHSQGSRLVYKWRFGRLSASVEILKTPAVVQFGFPQGTIPAYANRARYCPCGIRPCGRSSGLGWARRNRRKTVASNVGRYE